MPTPSTYNLLLGIPVFQGMGKTELQDIIAHTKLGFEKHEAGENLQTAGQRCNQLVFLMSGAIALTTKADDESFAITEDIDTPYTIEPERLFGIYNQCRTTVTTLTTCNIMTLDKEEVVKLLEQYTVFRFNLLNLISTQSQRIGNGRWKAEKTNLRNRLARFIETRCTIPKGTKHLRIMRKQLAVEMNMGFANMTKALHQLQNEGLLRIRRGVYDIPRLEELSEEDKT